MEDNDLFEEIREIINEDNYEDEKKELRQFLFEEIKNNNNLYDIKKNIRAKWKKSLNNLEHNYIGRKFIKYCAQFWLEDVHHFVTEELKNQKSRDILISIDHIKHIKDVPMLFQTSDYYKNLYLHSNLIDEYLEANLIHNIKLYCLEQTITYNATAKKELEFIGYMSSFLDMNYNNKNILDKLDLKGFVSGKISFEIFLKSIIRLKITEMGKTDCDTILLINSAESLQTETEYTLLKKNKEIISDFLKPVEIHEKVFDDRTIVEIKSRNLKISEIVKQLESQLIKNSNIVEVQFIVSENLYIDADLNQNIWHGKNIGILTKYIHVTKNVSWDISGKNNEHKYEADAGIDIDGCGKNAFDGFPGESGGNVLILAKNIFNEDSLSILSNGGNGSKGQSGGNGINGTDGEGISRSEFRDKFPSVIKFASAVWERTKKLKEMIRYIKNLAYTTQCEWYTDNNDPGACDVFLEVTTCQGNEITFSYCRGGFTRRYQGFLLYKGSLGKPGKAGGKNGLGGEGGFPGTIKVKHLQNQKEFKIRKSLNKGETGKAGEVGSHGKHGKNSWDMGYIDYQFWSETVIYDSQDNNINIEYYKNNSSDRVWCPYKDECNRYSYAQMEVQKIKHPQQITYENRQRTEENNDRQHSSKANKKKNILESNLLKDYQIVNREDSNKYEDLSSQFKEIDLLTIKALSRYDNKQSHKLGMRSNINRTTKFNNFKFNNVNEKMTSQSNTSKNKYKILKDTTSDIMPERFINRIYAKTFINEARTLKKLTHNLSNLNKIYKIWSESKSMLNTLGVTKEVESIFVEKYRIAVLQEIGDKVNLFAKTNSFSSKDRTNELSANQAIRYLSCERKKFTNIHHNDLGTFRQYIFENDQKHRDNIIQFCQKDFLQSNKDIFEQVFTKYFLEIPEKDLRNTNVKKYFDEYHLFLNDKKLNIMRHYNIFKSELSKFRHNSIVQTMLGRTIDDCIRNELKNKIEEDSFLSILYNRFKKQFQMTYNWENCFQDKSFLNSFFSFIKLKGPQARCYRELLAHIFSINLRVYSVDNKNEFTLLDNHNSSTRNIIYFSYNNATFSEIDINFEYLNLNKNREYMNSFFFTTLSDIYSIGDKQTLIEYLSKFDVTCFNNQTNLQKQIIQEEFDDEDDIGEISKFFPTCEREQVKSSLEKIQSNFIGHSGIIHIILRRFQYEGRYISTKEIRYIVNVILNSCLNDDKQENIFCWITATVTQSNWIAELIMVELESFFKKRLDKKSEILIYLSKLNPDILAIFGVKLYKYKQQNIFLSSSYVEDTLYLLSNINDAYTNLEDIELSEWLYILKEYYWINKIEKLFKWNKSDLDNIPYYILRLENMFGMSVVSQFLDILAAKNMITLHDFDTFDGILQNFADERWNLGTQELKQLKYVNDLTEWVEKLDETFYVSDIERNAKQLVNLIEGNYNTSANIIKHLPQILNTLSNINDRKYLVDSINVNSMSENDIKKFVQQFQSYKNKEKYTKLLLNAINRTIELKRGFRLRDTQNLTIMSFLLNKNSTLAQVSTGEGKSLIIVAISIMKALIGEKVDIVTSSSVLAIRDAVINKDIYDMFNISVGHNCSEVIQNRKETYSSSKVIYGDLSNFQRDYLLDRFYGENILGDHDFSNIIIDEVDSMLLDKGNNILYLSHDIAGLDKLESVYIYIWCSVNRLIQDATNISDFMDVSKIKESILNDMYGIIKKSDFEKVDIKLNEYQKLMIWNCLVHNNIIETNGRLIVQDIGNVCLNKLLPTDLTHLNDHIIYLLREYIGRQRFICVPKYLNNFIERHLESWINSAFAAFFMTVGHDYVVDVDRTKTISDGNPIITIIDRATGTDQISSQWDNALHQFLQLKHGCKLTTQNLKAVFISNVSYFKLYKKVYGLTGTLGSERERNLLKEVHTVDFVTVPTAKSKKFHEYTPIVCENKEMWIDNIYQEVVLVTIKEVRSILVICQFVEDVELLQKKLINMGIKDIYTYTRDYEDFDIARGSKKLKESQVIIATNLAGRGTDIILTDSLKEKGGLHVCLTYLPTNTRIERQAFGRAARCGDRGTGRLIVIDGSCQSGYTSKVLNIKKERDAEELSRISVINVEYNCKIKVEEKCFYKFKTLFEKIKKNFIDSEIAPEVISILLQCCLDNWAFWLDENTKDISTEDVNNYGTLKKSFQLFHDHLENLTCDLTPAGVDTFNTHKCFDLVKRNPIKMVILGKYFLTQNKFDQALSLFNTVITNEEVFSEAAHYYKAFIISKEINWEYFEALPQISLLLPFAPDVSKEKRKAFKDELLKSAKLFKEHAERLLHYATIIDKIKDNYPDSIIQIQAYTQQQQTYSNFYNMFIKSVDDILGTPVAFQNFTSVDINEIQALDLYDNLLREGLLNQMKVNKTIHQLQLEPICRDYGISTNKLKSFLEDYRNKYVDVNIFIKDLKNNIDLPSCGMFWNMLLELGILFNEIKYVIVDTNILNQIDPSFLELLNEKITSGDILLPNTDIAMTHNNSTNIFFTGICINEQKKKNNLIFCKNDLKSINPAKYVMLKRKGALSFNKMSSIDENKIKSSNFEQYDAIVLEDFSKININKEQAYEILSELVEEEILEGKKINDNKHIYKLKVPYEKLFQINLKSRKVYKSNVIGLLLSCFAYRIAIQKLQKQLNEKELNISIQLMTKPHRRLCYELIEHTILKNVKVTNKRKITEDYVKDLFGLPIPKEKFIQLLKDSQLIPKEKGPKLFDNLVSANWIQHCNIYGQVLHGKLYEVTKTDQNRHSLDIEFRPFQKSIEIFLNYRSVLGTENSVRSLTKTLNQLKSSMKSISISDNILKPLTDYFGSNKFLNVDELHIMSLTGLDHIQLLQEKKHSTKMLISTAIVFGFGLIQLAFGVIILYYSMGFMTHIGSILISEGISDMLYATSVYKSGYFSWNDYLNHKVQSLLFSAITVGVGAILTSGVRYSRYGYKLFGPALQETCGKELVKKTGTIAILKSISFEALKGIAICAANYGADVLVDRYLKEFCENIGTSIASDIETKVDSYKLTNRLETVYKMYGDSDAKKVLGEVTDSFFHNHNIGNNILPVAIKISSSIIKGVKEAATKKNFGSGIFLTVNIINKILVWTNRIKHLNMVRTITEDFINKLCVEIDEKIINSKDRQKTSREEVKFCQEKYDYFKLEITDNWKGILRQQSGRIISQNIVTPILEDVMNELMSYLGKKIKDVYKNAKGRRLESKLKELRQQFKKNIEEAKTNVVKEGHGIEEAITDRYYNDVLKLLEQTRDPKLFAKMILENVPMDLTCALASGPVIEALLQERGIVVPGLVIVFNTEEGIKQEVLIGPQTQNKQVIVLDLKNNHYHISSNSSNGNFESSENDCLYQALAAVIPGLRELGPNNFRTALARQIMNNPEIQRHIENGWHKYPIRLNLFGGAIKNRRKSSRREDPDSTDHEIKNPVNHLFDRFIRTLRVAGIVQRIAIDTGISRQEVVIPGPSEYQDRNSGRGSELPAAHVVRALIGDSINPEKHVEAFIELRNVLGHTQIVPKFVNEYHGGVGGAIDNIQGEAIIMATGLDFSSDTINDKDILNGVKNIFVNNIQTFLNNSKRLTEDNRKTIFRALERISETPISEMFDSGRSGFYNKKYRDAYM